MVVCLWVQDMDFKVISEQSNMFQRSVLCSNVNIVKFKIYLFIIYSIFSEQISKLEAFPHGLEAHTT